MQVPRHARNWPKGSWRPFQQCLMGIDNSLGRPEEYYRPSQHTGYCRYNVLRILYIILETHLAHFPLCPQMTISWAALTIFQRASPGDPWSGGQCYMCHHENVNRSNITIPHLTFIQIIFSKLAPEWCIFTEGKISLFCAKHFSWRCVTVQGEKAAKNVFGPP